MKKTIFLLIALLSAANITVCAQQPRKVTRKWFQNPNVSIQSPAFKHSYGYTSYKEMMEYLKQEMKNHPQQVTLETVGQTQRGRDIPLVVVSNGQDKADKLRILYTGCVHGNEHAGTEGLLWFIHQLTADSEVAQLLNNADFYIMPMVNADGSEADRRATDNGTDPNRDQTRLSTPEVRSMHQVATKVAPHVYIDFHEYKPLRSSYANFSDRLISNPNDYMYLYSSNPNVYPALAEMIESRFIPDAEQMARLWGLTTNLYYTTKTNSKGHTAMNIGGQAARSSSNIMALRGSISMLMEIRGIGLGRTSYLRRVNTAYQLACSFGRTAGNNADEVRRITAEAARQQRDIVTQYTVPTKHDQPFEFIDLLRNSKTTIALDAHPAKDVVAQKQVSRPEAYYINASEALAIELIRQFGIEHDVLTTATTLPLETYTVISRRAQSAEVLGMHPVNVTVRSDRQSIELPAGSIRIPMNQPLATLAGILLEPECANGFVNFRVVESAKDTVLPIYRSDAK